MPSGQPHPAHRLRPSAARLVFAVCSVACGLILAACVGPGSSASSLPLRTEDSSTARELKQAFADLCARLHYRPLQVEVDESESPALVYGLLEGRCDYRDMRDALNAMPGYRYGGSSTAVRSDGTVTAFAINMTRGAGDQGRVMARLKQLAQSQR